MAKLAHGGPRVGLFPLLGDDLELVQLVVELALNCSLRPDLGAWDWVLRPVPLGGTFDALEHRPSHHVLVGSAMLLAAAA